MSLFRQSPGLMAVSAFVIFVAFGAPARAQDQSLDIEKQKLDLITETADKLCSVVSMEGSADSSVVQGQISAELKGLASRLAGAGVSGTGTITSETYRNVLRKDLAATLQNNSNCKLRVFEALQAKLLSTRDLGSVAPANVTVLIGQWAGSYSCLTSVGQLVWTFRVIGTQLQVQEVSHRKFGYFNKETDVSYIATWNPPNLNLRSITGIDRYTIDLVLDRSQRHLSGNYFGHQTCHQVSVIKLSR